MNVQTGEPQTDEEWSVFAAGMAEFSAITSIDTLGGVGARDELKKIKEHIDRTLEKLNEGDKL